MPALECLDSTGPLAVKALHVILVKMFNVQVREFMFVLEEMRGV